MEAALDRFGTAGYHGTSIEELCAQARIATRSFYELFPSKEDLLLALYGELLAEVRDDVVAALAESGAQSEASARAGILAFTRALLADERKGNIVIGGLAGVSARAEERRRQAQRAFAQIIARRRAALGGGHLSPDELHVVAVALVGATIEVLIDWRTDPKVPFEVVVEQLVRLFAASTAQR